MHRQNKLIPCREKDAISLETTLSLWVIDPVINYYLLTKIIFFDIYMSQQLLSTLFDDPKTGFISC